MDQVNQYCNQCRATVFDLHALKAYHQPGDWTERLRCPNSRALASKYPPLLRSVEQFNADCPVCQIIWSAVRHDKETTPVRVVQVLAPEPDDHLDDGLFAWLNHLAKTPFRNVLFWLGYRDYCPVSLLQVVPWHCSEEYAEFPEKFSCGSMGELRIFTSPESPLSLKKHVSGRAICSPDSDVNIGKIQKWLKDCLESHRRCRTGISGARLDDRKGESILPSRVVAVGLESSSQVRLVETNGERGRYCALSYCWGQKSPRDSQNTLLTTTIDQFRQSLPVRELPKPIQEAIEVTRRIGVTYLWVDRLCIVQNDAKDVEVECSRMCDIYERALLTLAALGDDTGEKGLFLDRKALDHPISGLPEVEGLPPWRARLPCTIKDRPIGNVYLGRPLYTERGPDIPMRSCFDEELTESRWITRGWIMQERLLSRRIVHFGKRQLYWECQKTFKNEDGSPNDSSDLFDYQSVGLLKQSLVENLILEDIGRKFGSSDILITWRELVVHYSSRNLTFDTDKVRAISGIAEALRRRFSSKAFHFGMRMESLCEELMWYGNGTLKSPTNRRAPSWSWAAWDGQVDYFLPLPDDATLYVNSFGLIHLEPVPVVHLKGVVVQIQTHRLKDNQTEGFEDWLETIANSFPDNVFVSPYLLQQSSPGYEATITIHDKLAGVIHYDNNSDASSGCACLLLSCVEGLKDKRRVYCFKLLVLESVDPITPGDTFRRIGIAETVWVPEANIGYAIHQQPAKKILIV